MLAEFSVKMLLENPPELSDEPQQISQRILSGLHSGTALDF